MSAPNPVRRIVGPTILLSSGGYFDYEAPEASAFTIEDIAQGLSQTCRFAGQCPGFYSVAEHSVHVAGLVPREQAFAALMHDAAEAFVGDMPRPLKEICPEFRAIERRVEAAIAARFGLPPVMSVEIESADFAMLALEQRDLMRNRDDWSSTSGVAIPNVALALWSPWASRKAFLAAFDRYRPLEEATS